MDTDAVQPVAPPKERSCHGPPSESLSGDNKEMHAIVNVLLTQISEVVQKLLLRPVHTLTREDEFDSLFRDELGSAILGEG